MLQALLPVKQPRGKRVLPLVSEHARHVQIVGPSSCVPSGNCLESDWPVPTSCQASPASDIIPKGSKLLQCHPFSGGNSDAPCTMMKFGIPWKPKDFVQQACKCGHPSTLESGIPEVLRNTIIRCLHEGPVETAKMRTASLRKWVIRSKQLEEETDADPSFSPHCRAVLSGKSMSLFEELLKESKYGDKRLVGDLKSGFDLMGPLPETGIMPSRVTVASLTPAEVRAAAPINNRATLEATKQCQDREMAEAVYDATLKEKSSGWLTGPIRFEDLPPDAVLTRRFGVSQTSFDVSLGQVKKVRPIDDYTASLINLTNGSVETINPHGVDCILSAANFRLRKGRKLGLKEQLFARTIDLRKAYKQLPISERSLSDSFLSVLNPRTDQPEIYCSKVLPFGARAAVQGFCRVSSALFWIGVVVMLFQWTCFYDDFFLVGSDAEAKHLDLMQKGFFALLGWATLDEKGEELKAVARALGVEFSFADTRAGLIRVANTPGRVAELGATIDRLLNVGFVSASELVSLRGRLLFAESQVFGRQSKRAMKILSSRCAKCGRVFFDQELRDALILLRDRVVRGGPRVVAAVRRNRYLVFADACHESDGAGFGGILYVRVEVGSVSGCLLTT